jgi:hypothetical protein
LDPQFHRQTHGGQQNEKFDAFTRNFVYVSLWNILLKNPLGNVPFFRQKLQELDFNASNDDVRAIFCSWNWSWKIPSVQQLLKYTLSNIEYYFTFVVAIKSIPLEKMK